MKLATKIFKRDDWYVTSHFGNRNPIVTDKGITSNFHNGCDYGTNAQKWPQYAIENGVVISCGTASDGAKYVWVNYPRIGKKLLHYHLDSICVVTNQKVDNNTIIGYTGKTGKTTGIHLHLGMMNSNGGEYEDPDCYNYIESNKITNIDVAYEVINGKYGNGEERYNNLRKNGYNPKKIQNLVNEILSSKDKIIEYTVVKGDNLSLIAKKFNTTWNKIYEINRNVIGNNPNYLKIGLKLKIY